MPASGAYTPLVPVRILDTRDGTGRPGGVAGTVGAGVTIDLTCVGVGGVPSVGVAAVALTVMIIDPTAISWITMWPQGTVRPVGTANAYFNAAELESAFAVTKLSADGKASIYNNAGSVHLVADVAGWFAS
ncbi:MAG: hypothetical protein M3404_02520 [Actinomycetota bacterium]|nr:hypothetical protein [Actinomycetota bacterium]